MRGFGNNIKGTDRHEITNNISIYNIYTIEKLEFPFGLHQYFLGDLFQHLEKDTILAYNYSK